MKAYTQQQADEMFADMDYNDKMQENKFRMEHLKERIEIVMLSDLFLSGAMLVYEIYASWQKYSGAMGMLAAIIYFVVTLFMAIVVISKRIPEMIFINVAFLIVLMLVKFSIVSLIITLTNVVFYFLIREINEMKKCEDYPTFATRRVRHRD